MFLNVIYSSTDGPTGAERVLYDVQAKYIYQNKTNVIHKQYHTDRKAKLNSVKQWTYMGCTMGKQTPQSFRFIGDALFHLTGHANSENITFLKLIHSAALHDVNVGWCVVRSYGYKITGTALSETINSIKYLMTHFDITFWTPVRLRQKSMTIVC